MMRMLFLALASLLISAPNLFAGSLLDDYLQNTFEAYENLSLLEAIQKYDTCIAIDTSIPCWEERCIFNFCKDEKKWLDVQTGWCNSQMQAIVNCEEKHSPERQAAANAREKECIEINKKFQQEYKNKNYAACYQIQKRNRSCDSQFDWQWSKLLYCHELREQFVAATHDENITRMRDIAEKAQECAWLDTTNTSIQQVCLQKKIQFENHFKKENIAQCRALIDQAIDRTFTCDWVYEAESRLNLIDTSLAPFESGPAASLSDCMSMEAAYKQALSEGNKTLCDVWLEMAAGCSWRDSIVQLNETNPPTIGPAQDSLFSTSGGQYSNPDNRPEDISLFETDGGHYTTSNENGSEPPSPSKPFDCKQLEGEFNLAITSGDGGWAQSVLSRSRDCRFYSAGHSTVCQIFETSFRNAIERENWSSAEASLAQGEQCNFALNGAAQIRTAQAAEKCDKIREEFNGLMVQGQYILAERTVTKAHQEGCTIPNANIQHLDQALADLDQEYQQRVQNRENQQQAMFNTVMSSMAIATEINRSRQNGLKNGTRTSNGSSAGSSSTHNFPGQTYAGQEHFDQNNNPSTEVSLGSENASGPSSGIEGSNQCGEKIPVAQLDGLSRSFGSKVKNSWRKKRNGAVMGWPGMYSPSGAVNVLSQYLKKDRYEKNVSIWKSKVSCYDACVQSVPEGQYRSSIGTNFQSCIKKCRRLEFEKCP
ncbi:hypothetical protein SAMN02745165_03708 [Malonomonas rubra DSM 5091]|uniref:Uncharacterized protein n=1 Tax=Malonomonas rubra DSM 5091 TaxID=1122189 RepID=A0A1M6NUL8_MALRU|nr:hypothetical protein [Malonomonas rubra]SHJ99284.1 hypothetical protein SAMN02745165_03708 [Malonomonas rubra DSM 5091]